MNKQIILANPRGFCAGVDRAIAIVERALENFGAPVYVRHEVVHNKFVVDGLRAKGAVFIEELDDVPSGATLIYSAHGVSVAIQKEVKRRGFRIFDATCPLVNKVHSEVIRLYNKGYTILMIGHAGHPEVEGTMGQVPDRIFLVEKETSIPDLPVSSAEKQLAYVTQTTLSIDETSAIVAALKQHFPFIEGPKKDSICYATQNRQDAVKKLASECDLVIVVGSPNSSNSNRLREVAALRGVEAYMVDNASELQASWLIEKNIVGITAGASAPEVLVKEVVDKIKASGISVIVEQDGQKEDITFVLPKELRDKPAIC